MTTPRADGATPPPADKRTLSYQLREIVEVRGISPSELARQAGIDPGIVARFLDGRRHIRSDSLDRIAVALGLRLVEIARPARRTPGKAKVQILQY